MSSQNVRVRGLRSFENQGTDERTKGRGKDYFDYALQRGIRQIQTN